MASRAQDAAKAAAILACALGIADVASCRSDLLRQPESGPGANAGRGLPAAKASPELKSQALEAVLRSQILDGLRQRCHLEPGYVVALESTDAGASRDLVARPAQRGLGNFELVPSDAGLVGWGVYIFFRETLAGFSFTAQVSPMPYPTSPPGQATVAVMDCGMVWGEVEPANGHVWRVSEDVAVPEEKKAVEGVQPGTNPKQIDEVMRWAAAKRWKISETEWGHPYQLLIVWPADGGLARERLGDAGALVSGFAEVTPVGGGHYDVKVWTLPSEHVFLQPIGWRVYDLNGVISIDRTLHLGGDVYPP